MLENEIFKLGNDDAEKITNKLHSPRMPKTAPAQQKEKT